MIRLHPPLPPLGSAIVLVPGVGGTARTVRPLITALTEVPTAVALRRPGGAGTAGAADAIPGWAAELARQLVDGPRPDSLVVVGHSLGAYIALELVRSLQDSLPGVVRELVVAGQLPPHRLPPIADDQLDDAAVLRRVTGGGLPQELAGEPELLRFLVDSWRADYWAVDAYRSRPVRPIATPLRVWNSVADPSAPSGTALDDWLEYTTAPTAFATFEGGHDFLFTDVEPVAAQLRRLATPRAEVLHD
ncbi:alpha/beta fold hydrolase [Kitasatospora sp. RB6PN24]|uniref:thioesterase II family protein n=1 Tax=Kitasatospora humi TaxID=2893891 RepID=UPI001E429353|nr:alpha/beta fold hydrolase [Kitasatospora humi]MCC9308109.1 alpha/beta fold hydrolase [Kitasatospora humi]